MSDDDALVMFLDPGKGYDKDARESVASYGAKDVIIVLYSYNDELLDDIESSIPDCRVVFFKACGPDDRDLMDSVRNTVVAIPGRAIIDVTWASSYHAAQSIDLCGSGRTEVRYSKRTEQGIIHERLDRHRYHYGGLSRTEYMILDALNQDPQTIEQVYAKMPQDRAVSSVYQGLNSLWSRGLIDKVPGEVPPGYASRTPNFFCLNPDQIWDYYTFKRIGFEQSGPGSDAGKRKVSRETR